ncbi:hypothetical protein HY989_06910 [Candidatus Micrarchaeota archaeon]|nr:hypothetical protein [Candidatus Micrarchaeota archaeon]
MAEKSSSRHSPGFNLFLILVIISLFIVAMYFLYTEKNRPLSKQVVLLGKSKDQLAADYLKALETKYADKTILYEDPVFGYKLRYPIGYDAVVAPYPDIHQRFAAYYPPFSMELIDIRLLKSSEITEKDIQESAKELKTTYLKETINGNTVYLFSSREQSIIDENDSIFVKQAFFSCKDIAGKPYWLSFTGGVSEALAPDLDLVEYMIRTLKC